MSERRFDPVAVTEWHDIQALAKTGFGSLAVSVFLVAQVRDAAAARAWLGAVQPTAVADGKVAAAVQVALSAPGLAALGLDPSLLAQFGPEFRAGMTGDASRSRRLGDIGANDPVHWDWGQGDHLAHLLVLLYAENAGALKSLQADTEAALAPGFTLLATEIGADFGGREPFGFADGLSQPVVDWAGARKPGSDAAYTHLLAAGEVLLGYPNEYNCLTDRPLLDAAAAPGLPRALDDPARADLGRNGSYLVYRRLAQDVRGFWAWAEAAAGSHDGAVALAEAMVGRGITGQPVAALGSRVIPGGEDHDLNDFSYVGDDFGEIVAVGAHIRRANPRNADLPRTTSGWLDKLLVTLGLSGLPLEDAVSSTRFHRLLRRGRPYGTLVDPAQAAHAPAAPAGLHFIAVQASLSRQFEFVQGAWLRNPKFAGLSGEADPLLGNRCPLAGAATDGFTQPRPDGRRDRFALPQFVTVEAGGYFFLPGRRALRFIAGLV